MNSGETNSVLTLINVQLSQAGSYYATVSNAFGVATSTNALLTVLTAAPTIARQPADLSVYAGKTVAFTVQASGSPPLSYQWDKAGTPIPGATSSTCTLPNVQFSDAGSYRVTVSNDYGAVTSRQAVLAVLPPPVCTPVPEGAVAWWPGESNTWDVIGGFDGFLVQQYSSTLPNYTAGKAGTALKFTGNTYMQVSNGGGLNLASGNGLTIEGWVRPDAYGIMPIAEWSVPAVSGGSPGFVGAGLLLGDGGPGTIEATLAAAYSPLNAVTFRSAAYAVSNTVWQHVALTFDKSRAAPRARAAPWRAPCAPAPRRP